MFKITALIIIVVHSVDVAETVVRSNLWYQPVLHVSQQTFWNVGYADHTQ